MTNDPRTAIRNVLRVLTAIAFVVVGVMHFTHAPVFLAIMPPALPAPLTLVWVSGVAEILGGVGLLVPRTRRWAGWGLLLLLLAVFPANIHMALNGIELPVEGLPQHPVALWLRLPFQFVFAAQVWFVMGPNPTKTPSS